MSLTAAVPGPPGSPERSAALTEFAAAYDFPLDSFQVRACEALERGDGVLVAAPTGAGKTVVGEFAVHLALRLGQKCFYTTPIKALSNQKFADLAARYGPNNVGLLTGDNSINGDAPIVIMTTEVLRNMIYAGSSALRGLGYVVMDEVHYLSDRFRGAVWEEVIIHLPEHVRLVSPVRDREQHRGVRRLAGHRARPHRGRRRGAPAGTAVAARHGRRPALRPVRRPQRPPRARPLRRRARVAAAGQPRAGPPRPRRGTLLPYGTPRTPGSRRPATETRSPVAGRRGQRPRPRRPAAGHHLHLQPGRLRGRGPAVPALAAAADQRRRPAAGPRDRRDPYRDIPDEDRAGPRLPRLARGPRARASPRTTRACCRPSRRSSRSCSAGAWSRRSSPPRPWRSASTCRPARWCWKSW